MVDKLIRSFKWEINYRFKFINDFNVRCFGRSMGGYMGYIKYRRVLVFSRVVILYKCKRVFGSFFSILVVCKIKKKYLNFDKIR